MSLEVDIHKRFAGFELNVKFSLSGNESLGLLGASGSGKTLTLSCIAGIVKPDIGHIRLDESVLFDSANKVSLTPQKRRVGLLFQSYALFPNMTAEGNILCGLNHIKRRAEKRERLAELIASFRLVGLEKRFPRELSGGQQQRVALARLMACEPRLLMLDEPFAALDEALKWDMEQELFETIDRMKVPVLYVTHDMREVHRLCGRVCVMDAGRNQAPQTPSELCGNARTIAAARLSGCENVLEASRLDESSLLIDGERLRLPFKADNDVSGAAIRAADMKIGAGENELRCKLVRVASDDGRLMAVCRLKDKRMTLRVQTSINELQAYSLGDDITVSIPPSSIIPLKDK